MLAVGFAFDDFLAPIPQGVVVGDSPLQHNVGVLIESGQLARDIAFLLTFAVVHRVRTRIETRALLKASFGNSVHFNFEIKSTKWIFSVSHRFSLPPR